MMEAMDRPDPDALLAALKAEEARRSRGRLKVFLGMCPGVGKTYAMLEAARKAAAEGRRITIGIAETHGRSETARLLDGLDVLPRRKVEYRGTTLEEFDLDAALARRPEILVLDELAHSNAPGSRHPKRFHDALELLAAGIDILTTLNVQHLESRAEVVQQITRAPVRETVPDSILDEADEVVLVDITPTALRQRLAEGKVYLGERAATAASNFFRDENLTALREMALRATAERVDAQLRHTMRERNIAGPWKSGERLLVAIGPSPYSESLVRWTRRAAAARDCPWVAVHVETDRPSDDAARARISGQLTLARQLGAEVVTTTGDSIPAALLREARARNVTQIIVGKPFARTLRRMRTGRSLLDALLRDSGDIDICAVRPIAAPSGGGAPAYPSGSGARGRGRSRQWIEALLMLAATTAAGIPVERWAGYRAVSLIYLLAVVGAAFRLDRWVVFAMAVASALLWNLLFIPTRFTLTIARPDDAMMCGMFAVVALALGHLTSRLRRREAAERQRERRTAALFEMTNKAALAPDIDEGLRGALRQIEDLFRVQTALLLRAGDHRLAEAPHAASSFRPDERERSVAAWAFERNLAAGRFTDTLPDSPALWLPLRARTAVMGAMGVLAAPGRTLTLDERDWLENFALQIGSVLEKDHFIRAFRRAEVSEASERLRKTLLDSVSHELKTPLWTLESAVDGIERQPAEAARFLPELRTALRRLWRTIHNLLDMSRLESGSVRPSADWCDVTELCDNALDLAGDALAAHALAAEIPGGLPLVRADQALLEQALANLLLNASAHTPPGTEVTLRATVADGTLSIDVLDRGPGLPEGDPEALFEKFRRGEGARAGGTGLGLAIARGFLRAQGGDVIAARRDGGGAAFGIRLPTQTMAVEEAPA